MRELDKKIDLKKLSPIILLITMTLFLSIENRKLKGLALLIGTIIFIFASRYPNKRSKS